MFAHLKKDVFTVSVGVCDSMFKCGANKAILRKTDSFSNRLERLKPIFATTPSRLTVQNFRWDAFGVGFAVERLFDLVSMVVLALKAWRIGGEHGPFPHFPSIIIIFSKTLAGASALTASHSLLSGLAKRPTYSAKNSLGLCVATREMG